MTISAEQHPSEPNTSTGETQESVQHRLQKQSADLLLDKEGELLLTCLSRIGVRR
jgi:hypothetical protein